MRAIESWVLGYLVNAAWQAVVLFAGAWLLARGVRRLGPRVEHRVWVAALLAQVLRMSAIDAVRQWKWKPYLLNGQPTEVDTTITVNYQMF